MVLYVYCPESIKILQSGGSEFGWNQGTCRQGYFLYTYHTTCPAILCILSIQYHTAQSPFPISLFNIIMHTVDTTGGRFMTWIKSSKFTVFFYLNHVVPTYCVLYTWKGLAELDVPILLWPNNECALRILHSMIFR